MTNREKHLQLLAVPEAKRNRLWALEIAALFVNKFFKCPNCQRLHSAKIFADENPKYVQCVEHRGQPLPEEAKLCA